MRTSFILAGRPYCGMMTFWISAFGIPIKKAASSSCEETDCAVMENVLCDEVTEIVSPLCR